MTDKESIEFMMAATDGEKRHRARLNVLRKVGAKEMSQAFQCALGLLKDYPGIHAVVSVSMGITCRELAHDWGRKEIECS